ncbi:bifunctional diguanylate cyclase/phosphodiesterase [Actinocrinis sp.]|uniref:putative bifunctional diguanylate cyclase/phosphodiesterase n=1 Tax=Actinocrinis sp. TaxID=1920516 RepID=UPI002D24D00D|nr:bifunctional diguanylate cyclase/phosphodiesterase [Actinocrinis sp.]HZP54811.1 bifunctional diguanylate cyclase/phosphodiesterase [Actinocrinis sp.]
MSESAGDLPSAWAGALAAAGSVPMSAAETRALAAVLADWVGDALTDPVAARKAGSAVGTALIDSHHTQPESLAASIAVLSDHLPTEIDSAVRTALYAGLAAGYAEGLRDRTRREQEAIRIAVLDAHRTGEARFRAVFRGAALGIGIADGEGRILEINEPLARMLGRDARAARGLEISSLRLPTDPPEYWEHYRALLAGRRRQMTGEKQFVLPDGEVIWARMRASSVIGDDGKTALMVGLFEDVTERREMTERLRHQATHDPLTGLPNRTLLLEELAATLNVRDGRTEVEDVEDTDDGGGDGADFAESDAADVAGEPDEARRIAVCFLDIDGFKAVNDTLGHDAGDRLLIQIAARLREAVEPDAHPVARMGGDEFVILLPDTAGPQSAIDVAERVLAAIREPVLLDGRELSVTGSIGIVEQPVEGAGPSELLRAADVTLYWAKAAGRDRWALFDAQRNARQVARYALSQELPGALERGELFLEYQPIVDLADQRVRSLEALVRWNHPRLGLLGPGRFVPLAEETGAIVALGRWVLRRAVADAATWPRPPDGAPVTVSVNVAVPQVRDPGLVREVHDALEAGGLPPARLQLELTESAVMEPGRRGRPAVQRLRELSDLGVRIAIDDFGTGYSNLAYLRRLPAHTLKIDASFVKGLIPPAAADGGGAQESSEEPIVSSLINLARACGMMVIAEGVETGAQAEALRKLGADTGQGYYFSRPLPADQVPALILSGFGEAGRQ